MPDRKAPSPLAGAKARGWKHPESECPGCGKLINATSDAHGRGRPRPGDITIAICCGTILKFDRLLKLHACTPEDLHALPNATRAELAEQQERYRAHEKARARVISLPKPEP